MKKTFTYFLGGALFALFLLMPSTASATITATWDFTTDTPSGIQSVSISSSTGSVASDVSGVSMFVDATSGKLEGSSSGHAQFNAGTLLRIPVVSTSDVVTFVANSFNYKGVTIGNEDFEAGDPVVLTRKHTATKDDVAQGYVLITSKGDYLNTVSVELAYMPASAISAVWDWHNGIPASITSSVAEGEDVSGSIKSNNNLSLDYLGATSGVYVKLQYNENSGNPYAQFNTNTAIHIPVTSSSDILTVVSYPGQYNYKVGGVAATGNTTIHKATSDEVTAGYIEILATATAYLYSISLEKRASVTIGSTGWATFSNSFATDFTGVTVNAKIVTGVSGSALTMTDVTGTAAANTGLLLNADEGTYAIPLTTTGTDYSSTNKLVAGTGAAVNYNSGAGYNYVLAKNGGVAVFQRIVEGTYGSVTVAKGKAYLALASDPGAHELTLDFSGGGSTDIQLTKDMGQSADGVYYNLAGQRVVQPTKGLYIVNGKKVVIR